ncbi:MAG: MFS transporter [Chloroflexota bacterium]|nr:MFS transporter [Chloroflexota bacterium]
MAQRMMTRTVRLALLTLGALPLAVAGGQIAIPLLLASLGVAGVGIGLSSAGMQTAAIKSVGPHEAGVASGVFSTSRYFGSIVGSVILAGLLGASGGGGFRAVFIMVAIAALLSALALPDRPRRTTDSAEEFRPCTSRAPCPYHPEGDRRSRW